MSGRCCGNPRDLADTANRAATFHPMTHDDERPTITVAGVQVAVYIDSASQHVRVSVDLDTPAQWLLRNDVDATVPLDICVQGVVVFEG